MHKHNKCEISTKRWRVSLKQFLLGGLILSTLVIQGCGSGGSAEPQFESKAELGEALFSDVNLSMNRTQSCATCHNPDAGFADDRESSLDPGHAFAASLGDDDVSFGDRNAPTAGYAAFIPEFSNGTRTRNVSGFDDYTGYLGGQFWDGRESNLTGQAGGPPTNPIEMGMVDADGNADKAGVVNRLKENAEYISAFESLFDKNIFDDVDAAYLAMAESIASFEKTDEFSPFDSKYDLSLEVQNFYPFDSEYEYSGKAGNGKGLFFNSDLNCAGCHQLKALNGKQEIFTGFEYHNIGVPENAHLKDIRLSEMSVDTSDDMGLYNNSNVTESGAEKDVLKGKFKVPTLRNVAITAPYMHNGVFNKLETVLKFYEHARFRTTDGTGTELYPTNPETDGEAWGEPEVAENMSLELAKIGANVTLDEDTIEELECFLLTLTDAKYEHLLDQAKVDACGI